MRLEIVVSKAQYNDYRVALLEVKPSWPDCRKLYIGFHNTHLRIIDCRECAKNQIHNHRRELEQVRDALLQMGLETTYFHSKFGFDYMKLITRPLATKRYLRIIPDPTRIGRKIFTQEHPR